MYRSIIAPLNLGIHELGHFVFSFFGRFIEIAGGTILQCLVPIIGMLNFLRQRDYFAVAICFGWLSTNFFDVATYVGDARSMSLPLVGPGMGEIIHDWHYLLGKLHLLNYDHTIASLIRLAGVASMLVCLIFGAWLLLEMIKSKSDSAIGGMD